jgi:hypothetical protein
MTGLAIKRIQESWETEILLHPYPLPITASLAIPAGSVTDTTAVKVKKSDLQWRLTGSRPRVVRGGKQ